MDFATSYNRQVWIDDEGCEVDQTLLTEQSGYMTIDQEIERLMVAHAALDAWRKGYLDVDVEEGDDYDGDDQIAQPYYSYDPVDLSTTAEVYAAYRDARNANLDKSTDSAQVVAGSEPPPGTGQVLAPDTSKVVTRHLQTPKAVESRVRDTDMSTDPEV
jgi:hypothetical protein